MNRVLAFADILEQQIPLPHYYGIGDYSSVSSGSQAKNGLTEQVHNCRTDDPEVHIERLAACGQQGLLAPGASKHNGCH